MRAIRGCPGQINPVEGSPRNSILAGTLRTHGTHSSIPDERSARTISVDISVDLRAVYHSRDRHIPWSDKHVVDLSELFLAASTGYGYTARTDRVHESSSRLRSVRNESERFWDQLPATV